MRIGTISRLPAPGERSIAGTAAQDSPIDPSVRLKKRRRTILAGGSAALLMLIGSIWLVHLWRSTTVVVPRDRVRIATVSRGHFIRDVSAQGTAVAAVSPTLFAPAMGTVTLLAKAGETVRKSQVLATIYSPTLTNEYERERATLDSVDAALQRQDIDVRSQLLQNQQTSDLAAVQLKAAEREYQRSESALQEGVIPQRDLDRARDSLDSAKLTHEHALANAKLQEEVFNFELKTKRLERERQRLLVEGLKRRVDDLTVHSPVDGMIGSLAVNDKTAVGENSPLLTVVDLSALEVEFHVPESYADSLAPGMPAQVAFAGKTYPASVLSISPEVQQSEVTGRVRFTSETPPGLRQNQRLELRIIMDSRDNVLKVERGGFTEAGNVAYVVNGDLAARRPIRIGATSVSEVEILEGLAPGDHIIVTNTNDFSAAPVVRLGN
jgi:HlyD family secretion protein